MNEPLGIGGETDAAGFVKDGAKDLCDGLELIGFDGDHDAGVGEDA
jgi:hypothetical protein